MAQYRDTFQILEDQDYNYGTRPDFPVAEQNQTYFAYWDGIGGTGAEIPNNTAYFIKYIIDTEGNIVNPEPKTTGGTRDEAVGLYNLLNNFEVGKRAIVKLIEPDPTQDTISEESDLLGTYTITGIGTLKNIMSTETGPYPNSYLDTMSFYNVKNPNNTLAEMPQFNARYEFQNNYLLFNSFETSASYVNPLYENGFDNTLTSPGAPVPPLAHPYRTIMALSSSINVGTRIRFVLYLKLSQDNTYGQFGTGGPNINYSLGLPNSVSFRMYKNGQSQDIFSSNYIANIPFTSNPNTINSSHHWFSSPWINVTENDEFTLKYQLANNASGAYADYLPIIIESGSQIAIEQEYNNPDVEIPGFNVIYSPYFKQIIHYPNYTRLVFNDQFDDLYLTDHAQLITEEQISIGFSPSQIPFNNISVGDFIRFELNPDMVYKIIKVNPSTLQNGVVYKLSIDVAPSLYPTISGSLVEYTSSIVTNHFNIYRIENDGRYVILDVPKTSKGNAYSGILQSEFSSQELLTKYDKLIADLSQKEIIQ